MTEKKSMHVEEDNYQVGYKNPPKHTQFKKGQSGNPGGRPPGYRFEKDEDPLRQYMLEHLPVKIGGKKVRMPAVDLIVKSLVNKAIHGCFRSTKLLIEQSGGLKALREEYKQQVTKADLACLEELQKEADGWVIK